MYPLKLNSTTINISFKEKNLVVNSKWLNKIEKLTRIVNTQFKIKFFSMEGTPRCTPKIIVENTKCYIKRDVFFIV